MLGITARAGYVRIAFRTPHAEAARLLTFFLKGQSRSSGTSKPGSPARGRSAWVVTASSHSRKLRTGRRCHRSGSSRMSPTTFQPPRRGHRWAQQSQQRRPHRPRVARRRSTAGNRSARELALAAEQGRDLPHRHVLDTQPVEHGGASDDETEVVGGDAFLAQERRDLLLVERDPSL